MAEAQRYGGEVCFEIMNGMFAASVQLVTEEKLARFQFGKHQKARRISASGSLFLYGQGKGIIPGEIVWDCLGVPPAPFHLGNDWSS